MPRGANPHLPGIRRPLILHEIDAAVGRGNLEEKGVRPITLLQDLPHFQAFPLPGETQGAFMEAMAGIGGHLAAPKILEAVFFRLFFC
jgi:hypothetical protein